METRSRSLYYAVCEDIRRHCRAKGYSEGDGINNFLPHDAVAAYGMAKLLVDRFDRFVAVAPEGHIYGYFFERLGVTVLSAFTDYPPTRCTSEDDFSLLENQRVLLIEDDVISGQTLQLVVKYLSQFKPASMSLYLGHNLGIQHLDNVPKEIGKGRTFLAELELSKTNWKKLEADFQEFCKFIES